MIDLNQIKSQITQLQRCVMNLEDAKLIFKHQDTDPESKALVERCENTLVCQLILMNYQNEKLLK